MSGDAPPDTAVEQRVAALRARVDTARRELRRVFVGQDALVELVLMAIVAGGHVLIEGLPGLGKTLLVRSITQVLGLRFARIQFTPDLMPADITGTRIIEEVDGHRSFRFQEGPVFANLVLADEINRATPKTQSALLEAMQEASVTTAGETRPLPAPFSVIATQNPIELEGTFPLPEAQLDRFLFKVEVERPPVEDLIRILDTTTGGAVVELVPVLDAATVLELRDLVRQVLCGPHLLRLVAELLRATDPRDPGAGEAVARLVRHGASPRAGQAMVLGAKARALLDGRPSVAREDLEAVALPALRHRVLLGFEAEAEGVDVAALLPDWWRVAARRAG